jgi:hypothetical protein
MSIQQFNGEWVAKEDRMLIRINTSNDEEFRFWFTRLILKNLLQGAHQVRMKALEQTHAPEVAQVLEAFQQQTVAQQVKFEKNFKEGAQKPLGEEPALVTGITLQADAQHIQVALQLANGKNLRLNLQPHVWHRMAVLLHKLQDNAQWGIAQAEPPTHLVSEPKPGTKLH